MVWRNQVPLTDADTNVVVERVLIELRKRRLKWIATALAMLSAGASMQTCFLNEKVMELVVQRVQETTEPIQETTEELAQRPYVEGLDSEWFQADRLVIIGTAFGSVAGSIELFYKVPNVGEESTGETRTPTLYLSDESIERWTDDEIIVRTTEQERQRLLERVNEPDFTEMIPYIRVVRADRTRSSVW